MQANLRGVSEFHGAIKNFKIGLPKATIVML